MKLLFALECDLEKCTIQNFHLEQQGSVQEESEGLLLQWYSINIFQILQAIRFYIDPVFLKVIYGIESF